MKHNWTYKKLGEVATLTGGFTPKADELFSEGKYPYFKVSDMNTAGNEVVLTKTPSFVVDSKKCYPKGAIVFPKNGAAVSTNKKRILGQDSIVDLNTCAAILNSGLDVKFAYYWFYKLDFKTLVRGGALPTLDLKGLRSLQIPIPSLDEQQAIVRELDGINRLIDLQEVQLCEYDRLAQSLFYTTFGDPATNPKGWEVKNWSDVLEIINGKNQSAVVNPNGKYLLCGSGGEMGRADDYLCEENSVIIGRKGNINRPLLMREKFWNVDTAFGLQPKKDVLLVDYLYQFCVSFNFENLNVAVTIPSLRKVDLLKIQIPLPPIALQQTFAAQIEAIEQQKALIRRSLDETRTLLAARMQYYFE